jgi:hypothetical protein
VSTRAISVPFVDQTQVAPTLSSAPTRDLPIRWRGLFVVSCCAILGFWHPDLVGQIILLFGAGVQLWLTFLACPKDRRAPPV